MFSWTESLPPLSATCRKAPPSAAKLLLPTTPSVGALPEGILMKPANDSPVHDEEKFRSVEIKPVEPLKDAAVPPSSGPAAPNVTPPFTVPLLLLPEESVALSLSSHQPDGLSEIATLWTEFCGDEK